MIEAAPILSGILQHWADLIIISALLVFNAIVGFWQEHQAANAVAALRRQRCSRRGLPRPSTRLSCRCLISARRARRGKKLGSGVF